MKRTRIKATKVQEPNMVLACDPSLTAFGYAVLQGERVVSTGCIKTEGIKGAPKGRDRMRRVGEIVKRLDTITKAYDIELIVSELASGGSKSAVAGISLAYVTGAVQAISDVKKIPVKYYHEKNSKKAVMGRSTNVEKDEMLAAIKKLYQHIWTGTKYIDQAVADSLAIHYTWKTRLK